MRFGPWALAALAGALVGVAFGVSGCGWSHQIQRLPSPDRRYVLIVDYINKPFGTRDVAISLEENRGLAATVASFANIDVFQAGWLGPEDVGVCQTGRVLTFKTHIVLNAHDGPQDFYIHYKCPIG